MPAAAVKTRIGFVTGGKSSMPHYRSFLPLVPEDVVLDFHGSDLCGASLYEIADKKEFIVSRVTELAAANAWRGVILTVAPTEVLNRGLYDNLKAALTIRSPLRCMHALRR